MSDMGQVGEAVPNPFIQIVQSPLPNGQSNTQVQTNFVDTAEGWGHAAMLLTEALKIALTRQAALAQQAKPLVEVPDTIPAWMRNGAGG